MTVEDNLDVWSGRAPQEVSPIWRLCGLASMYPASDWSVLCAGPSPALFSGGGGLVSTAPDYLRFCQMLLNGGELGGVRILSPETVQLMTADSLPADIARQRGKLGARLRHPHEPRSNHDPEQSSAV